MARQQNVEATPIGNAGQCVCGGERFEFQIQCRQILVGSRYFGQQVRLLIGARLLRREHLTSERLGLNDNFPDNATFALGTGSVGVMQLAAAYAVFFNGGSRVTPYGLTGINGGALATPPAVPVIDPALAQEMQDMLRAVVTGGTGTAGPGTGPAAVAGCPSINCGAAMP